MKIFHFMATYVCFAISFAFICYLDIHAHLKCLTANAIHGDAKKTHDSKVIIVTSIHLDVNSISHMFMQTFMITPIHVNVGIHIDGILSSKTIHHTY